MFKLIVSKIRRTVIRLVNLTKAPKKELYPFDKKIWKDIEEVLTYGGEPKYHMLSGSKYNISIQEELIEYHEVDCINFHDLVSQYEHLVKYLNYKLLKYKTSTLVESRDDYGLYFIVKVLPE